MSYRTGMKKWVIASVVGCTLLLPVHAYADSPSDVRNDLSIDDSEFTLLVENYQTEMERAQEKLSELKKEREEIMEVVKNAKNNLTSMEQMIEEHEEKMEEKEEELRSLREEAHSSAAAAVVEEEIILLTEKKETLLEMEKLFKKRVVESEQKKETIDEKMKDTESSLQSLKAEKQQAEYKASEVKQEMDKQSPHHVVLEEGKVFIQPAQGRISSEYGPRWGRMHHGIDIANHIGTPILAAADGVVKEARSMNGYGNTIVLQHEIDGQTYETLYAHLNTYHVGPGDKVQVGQQIAEMGNTGRSTGPHLHFETHVGGSWSQKNQSVDPRKLTGF